MCHVGTDRPASGVAIAFSSIESAASALDDKIGMLFSRLEPIMRPSSPAAVPPGAQGDCSSCKVAEQLNHTYHVLDRLNDRVGELLSRIDL